MLGGLKQNLMCTRTQRPHRDWARTVFEFLLHWYRSAADCYRGRGSGCSRPGYGISPLEEITINPTHRAARTDTRLGNRLLEGTNKSLCVPGPRRKESSNPTRDWPRLAHEYPGVSGRGMDRQWPASGLGTLCSSAFMGPFEGGHHYLHYLHHHLVSSHTTGREHSPTQQQKIGLKIYRALPCPSEQHPVSPSISLYHQEVSMSLLSFSIRGQTEWKPQSQKTNQSDHMDHSLILLDETMSHAV